jgi:hypothetical protein
MIALGDGVS